MKVKKVLKPWGYFERFIQNEKSTVKILYLSPYEELSLQRHFKREEFWLILEGSCQLTINDKTFQAGKGEYFEIKKGEKHRAKSQAQKVSILEISKGDFSEKDIIRLEDKYRRDA